MDWLIGRYTPVVSSRRHPRVSNAVYFGKLLRVEQKHVPALCMIIASTCLCVCVCIFQCVLKIRRHYCTRTAVLYTSKTQKQPKGKICRLVDIYLQKRRLCSSFLPLLVRRNRQQIIVAFRRPLTIHVIKTKILV